MHRCTSACIGTVLLVLIVTGPAMGESLLVSDSGGSLGVGYGYYKWGNMTAALNAVFETVDVAPDFENLGQMLSYDRLWLDQRGTDESGASLSANEINNITAFVATGRRLVLLGENNLWTSWNNQILGIGGGTYWSHYDGTATVIAAHDLTAGVSSVDLRFDGRANGGTALFDQNWATLWGGDENLLTLLSYNVMWDEDWGVLDNGQFALNVADWLVAPEPATLSLLVLGGLLVTRRRR